MSTKDRGRIVQYRGEKFRLSPREKIRGDEHEQASILRWNIQYLKNRYGETNRELAEVVGICEDTFTARLAEPWKFNLGDLEKLSAHWKFSISQLTQEIAFVAGEPIMLEDERYISEK